MAGFRQARGHPPSLFSLAWPTQTRSIFSTRTVLKSINGGGDWVEIGKPMLEAQIGAPPSRS
jgi:hypothetical protein